MKSAPNMKKNETIPEMTLKPVGIIRNRIKKPSLIARSGDLKRQSNGLGRRQWKSVVSELIVDTKLAGILDGIEDFSHILVLYWAHCVPPEGRSFLKAHPQGREDLPLVGIFSTCSPARPNPVCVTAVRLLKRKKNVLRVEGLDAIDGSILLDIKPYNPVYYVSGDLKLADWMVRLKKESCEDSYSASACE